MAVNYFHNDEKKLDQHRQDLLGEFMALLRDKVDKIQTEDGGGKILESTATGEMTETGLGFDRLMEMLVSGISKIPNPRGGKLVESDTNANVKETDISADDKISKLTDPQGDMVLKSDSGGNIGESDVRVEDLVTLTENGKPDEGYVVVSGPNEEPVETESKLATILEEIDATKHSLLTHKQ